MFVYLNLKGREVRYIGSRYWNPKKIFFYGKCQIRAHMKSNKFRKLYRIYIYVEDYKVYSRLSIEHPCLCLSYCCYTKVNPWRLTWSFRWDSDPYLYKSTLTFLLRIIDHSASPYPPKLRGLSQKRPFPSLPVKNTGEGLRSFKTSTGLNSKDISTNHRKVNPDRDL